MGILKVLEEVKKWILRALHHIEKKFPGSIHDLESIGKELEDFFITVVPGLIEDGIDHNPHQALQDILIGAGKLIKSMSPTVVALLSSLVKMHQQHLTEFIATSAPEESRDSLNIANNLFTKCVGYMDLYVSHEEEDITLMHNFFTTVLRPWLASQVRMVVHPPNEVENTRKRLDKAMTKANIELISISKSASRVKVWDSILSHVNYPTEINGDCMVDINGILSALSMNEDKEEEQSVEDVMDVFTILKNYMFVLYRKRNVPKTVQFFSKKKLKSDSNADTDDESMETEQDSDIIGKTYHGETIGKDDDETKDDGNGEMIGKDDGHDEMIGKDDGHDEMIGKNIIVKNPGVSPIGKGPGGFGEPTLTPRKPIPDVTDRHINPIDYPTKKKAPKIQKNVTKKSSPVLGSGPPKVHATDFGHIPAKIPSAEGVSSDTKQKLQFYVTKYKRQYSNNPPKRALYKSVGYAKDRSCDDCT